MVWDGCTAYEKTRLERIQYEAARIVTGLTRSVSIDKLIKEIGWLPLSDRRLFQKAVLMYKIINGLAPEYISNIMPPFVSERTEYSLRNAADISVLSRRTEIYSRSFFPSSVDYWNKLPLSVRSADSVSAFKQLLKRSIFRSPEIPNFFVSGQRISSVYHCRIRNNCSDLNDDLFNNHLKPTAACDCGFESEDAEHYFFFSNRFTQQRTSLFQAIRKFQPVGIRLLLYGSPDLSDDDNVELFSYVQHFIKETNRF